MISDKKCLRYIKHTKKRKGFTLIEVIIVLAVFAILMAALFPKIARIIEDAKVSRAKTEVDNIGTAIHAFNSHTTLWPAGKGTGLGGKPFSHYELLISGSIGEDKITSAILGDLPGIDTASLGTDSWNTGVDTADYFDNHLRLNNPGDNRGYSDGTFTSDAYSGRYFPVQAKTGDNPKFQQRVKEIRYHWKGPYIDLIGFDPWGKRYMVNISSAWSTDPARKLISLALSGGPDNMVYTDGNTTTTEYNTFQSIGDDIIFIIRKRKGSV